MIDRKNSIPPFAHKNGKTLKNIPIIKFNLKKITAQTARLDTTTLMCHTRPRVFQNDKLNNFFFFSPGE